MKHNEVEIETVYDEMPKSLIKSRSRRRLSLSFKSKRISKTYLTPLTKLHEYHPLEVARQLTLLESHYFIQIQPRECLNCCWSKDKTNAPNMLALIERFNMVQILSLVLSLFFYILVLVLFIFVVLFSFSFSFVLR